MDIVRYVVGVVCIVLFSLVIYFFLYKSKGIERIRVLETVKSSFSKKIQQPKLIIMGGSDVLYSFRTDYLAEQLNMPVVNFGTNVGLGLGHLIDFTKEHAKAGDTIVACVAYSLYSNPAYHIFAFEYYRMFARRKLRYFSLNQLILYFFGNLKLNITYVQKKFDLDPSGCYLNVIGTDFPAEKNKPLSFPKEFVKTEALQKLEDFRDYCKEKNIDFWLTFPSTLKCENYSSEPYLKKLEKYLRENYQVIGAPSDYYVEKEEIYNSIYHINEKGQLSRTEKAIQEFNQILNGGQ